MEMTRVEKRARMLKRLVKLALMCNVLAMLMVPSILYLGKDDLLFLLKTRILELAGLPGWESEPIHLLLFGGLGIMWVRPVVMAHTLFLWICGSCTIVILWQALTILNTILEKNPFQTVNAQAMRYAATACWVVSGTALVRLGVELAVLRHLGPLFTYNALFVPVFFAGGLLFLVMSALFRQAAQMKEEQDLTI